MKLVKSILSFLFYFTLIHRDYLDEVLRDSSPIFVYGNLKTYLDINDSLRISQAHFYIVLSEVCNMGKVRDR